MATSNFPISSSDRDVESSAPLLTASTENQRSPRLARRQRSLRDATRILRRVSTRRMMRESSMIVREAAAEQLEERQSDWAYSKPVVVLDMLWNFTFVMAAAVFMVLSWNESPKMPLRVWILGYAFQCVLHILCVCVEYQRRRRTGGDRGDTLSRSSQGSQYVSLMQFEENNTSAAKYLESANTMFSFIWWIIGFYWVSMGGEALVYDSPQLYWLSIIFLAFDVFFIVFCVAVACIIGVAVCCCLPCIIALLYIVADEGGASKEDIEQLPTYKFHKSGNLEKENCEPGGSEGGIMTESGTDSPIQHALSAEDAECCICLSSYEEGIEIRELPCSHHFHCSCVDKWLLINATCPLCKYNILKNNSTSSGEDQA